MRLLNNNVRLNELLHRVLVLCDFPWQVNKARASLVAAYIACRINSSVSHSRAIVDIPFDLLMEY